MSSWTSGLTDNWRLKISYSSQIWKRLASWPSLSVIYHTSRKATCFPAISATQNSFGYTALAECASHFRCMLLPMYLVDISGSFHVAGPSFTASECCHSAPTLLALSRAYWNMCVASLPGDLRIRSTIKHLYTHGRLRHKSPSGSWGLFVHPVGTSYSPDSLHHLICSPDFAAHRLRKWLPSRTWSKLPHIGVETAHWKGWHGYSNSIRRLHSSSFHTKLARKRWRQHRFSAKSPSVSKIARFDFGTRYECGVHLFE